MGWSRTRNFRTSGHLAPWLVWALLACGGDGEGPLGSSEGALEVITNTIGLADENGYSVTVDQDAARSIAANAAVTIAALRPGPHIVELADIVAGCVLYGDNPRTVDVSAGEKASVLFSITCPPAPLVQVSVSTTGSELDPDGYDVWIDREGLGPVGPNGTVTAPALKLGGGTHTITLTGVAPNCSVSGEYPRTVTIADGEPISIHLDVVCRPAGSLLIGVVTPTGDPDPDGYVVTLNGGPRKGLGSFGGKLAFLEPGDYTVVLSDVAPHCTLVGSNTATATVVSGGEATVTFDVACGRIEKKPPGWDIVVGLFTEIYLLRAGGGFQKLTDHPDHETNGTLSPDGQKIAFTSYHYECVDPLCVDELLISYIAIVNADGSGRTQLTSGGTESGPAWSPDGSRIAYVGTTSDNTSSIFVMNADGSGQTPLVSLGTQGHSLGDAPAWSPDGSRIAYAGPVPSHPGIFVVNADGNGNTRLTDGFDGDEDWSPDGTRIAFRHFVLGQGSTLYVMNADGSGRVPVASDTVDMSGGLWSPDGTRIAFRVKGSIYLVNPDGTGSTQLTFGEPQTFIGGWSPDGSKLAYYTPHSPEVNQNRLWLMNRDGTGEVPVSPIVEAVVPTVRR